MSINKKPIPECVYCWREGWYYCGRCGDNVCEVHISNPNINTFKRDPYRCKKCEYGA